MTVKRILILLSLLWGGLFITGAGVSPSANEGEMRIIAANEVLEEDVFFGGIYFENNGVINGSLYVASEKALINGTVRGNLILASSDAVINAHVTGDVFLAAQGATFTGITDGSIFTAGETLDFQASTNVARSIYAAGSQVSLYGAVDRDVRIAAETMIIKGLVAGDLYYSAQNTNIVSGSVKGEQIVNKIPDEADQMANSTATKVFTTLSFIFSALVIWLLLNFVFKDTHRKIGELFPKEGRKVFFYYGAFGIFAAMVLGIVLLISFVGIPFGLILLLLVFSGLYLSSGVFVVALSDYLGKRFPRYGTGNNIFFVLAVGVLFSLLKLIPFIGVFVSLIGVTIGFGLMLGSFQKLKEKSPSTGDEHNLIL